MTILNCLKNYSKLLNPLHRPTSEKTRTDKTHCTKVIIRTIILHVDTTASKKLKNCLFFTSYYCTPSSQAGFRDCLW